MTAIAEIESTTTTATQAVPTRTYTLQEIIDTLELTPEETAELAGVSVTTIKRNLFGSKHATKDVITECIAAALGMSVDEIVWQNGITNQGRMPGTWDDNAKANARTRGARYTVTHSVEVRVHTTVKRVCANPICNMELPVSSNICSVC